MLACPRKRVLMLRPFHQEKAAFQDQKLNINLQQTQNVSQASLAELARNQQRYVYPLAISTW